MENKLYEDLLNAASILVYEEKCKTELDKLKRKKTADEASKKSYYEGILSNAKKRSVAGFFVPGMILTCLGLLFMFVSLVMSTDSEASDESFGWIMGFIFLIPGVIFLFLAYKKKGWNDELLRQAQKEYNQFKNGKISSTKVERYQHEITTLQKEVESLRFDKLQATAFLPIMYADVYSVCYMLLLVENGRCDTLKEAINMLELERRHHQLLDGLQVIAEKLDYVNYALDLMKTQIAVMNKNIDKIRQIEKIEFLTQ